MVWNAIIHIYKGSYGNSESKQYASEAGRGEFREPKITSANVWTEKAMWETPSGSLTGTQDGGGEAKMRKDR